MKVSIYYKNERNKSIFIKWRRVTLLPVYKIVTRYQPGLILCARNIKPGQNIKVLFIQKIRIRFINSRRSTITQNGYWGKRIYGPRSCFSVREWDIWFPEKIGGKYCCIYIDRNYFNQIQITWTIRKISLYQWDRF